MIFAVKESNPLTEFMAEQAEFQRAGIENLGLARRLRHDEREDPDVEGKLLVEGTPAAIVPGDF